MASILKWPRIWFEIFLKPSKTAASLKKERPSLVDGIISLGLCSLLIGIVAFMISAILVVVLGSTMGGGEFAAGAAGIGVGLLMMFGICVIAFPISMVVSLVITTIFLKISSLLLKGRGSFGQECGILGVVGSSYMIVMVLLMVAIYIPMVLAFAIAGPDGFGVVMGLVYLVMGVAYLITMPLMYLLMAFLFDLLAEIEQISIYRSGALFGLMFGVIMFIIMLMGSIMMFLIGGFMYMDTTQVKPDYYG